MNGENLEAPEGVKPSDLQTAEMRTFLAKPEVQLSTMMAELAINVEERAFGMNDQTFRIYALTLTLLRSSLPGHTDEEYKATAETITGLLSCLIFAQMITHIEKEEG